jgi:polyisoprenoid-binding protein YceI
VTRWLPLAGLLLLALLAWACPAAAGPRRFTVDPRSSEITFHATSRLMNAVGRFHRFEGEILVDPRDPTTARIRITIEAASIDTGIALRDRHLRDADFLDVNRYPTVTFESIRVEGSGRRATVVGRLTLHGVTREIAVPVDVLQLSDSALVASGEFALNRQDYGISYQSFLNPVGNEVRVAFTVRARPA